MKYRIPRRYLFTAKMRTNIPDNAFAALFSQLPIPPTRVQRRIHMVELHTFHRGRTKATTKKMQVLNIANPDMKPLIHKGRKTR